MKFIEDMAPYLEAWPYISNKPGELLDGNAILYCGVAMVIKNDFAAADDGDYLWIQKVYRDARVTQGLLNRAGKIDHESHDDYVGLCSAAQLVDMRIAQDVCARGWATGWIYDNTGIAVSILGKLKCWHARMPGIIQHYKMCAGVRISIWGQLWWAIGMIPGSGTSGDQLRWLRFRAFRTSKQKYRICAIAANLWENRIRRKYPNLMGDVFGIYYSPTHPFSLWMQGRI